MAVAAYPSYWPEATKRIRPYLGRLRLWAVTTERVEGLYAEALRCREHCPSRPETGNTAGNESGHVCRPLSHDTVRKIHHVLSPAFRRAVRWRWIDHNPAKEAAVPPAPHPEPQPPTVAEAAQILAEAWKHPDLGPLVWVAMATGARRGELCALRWRHIDTTRGLLVIRSAIAQARGRVWEKDTKLHQRRHIALDPVTVAILTAYHQQRQRRAAAVGVDLSDDGFVFSPRADARRCRSPQGMTSQYGRLVRRLGIRTSLHKLRHYSATELIRAGVDVRTVAGRLGHSDGGTTLAYYAAWVRESDQRASRVLMDRLPLPAPPHGGVPPPCPARPASSYRLIADELRTAIHDGTLRPGTVLPAMKQLAAQHHVAVSTIHRAIALLTAEHLVTVSRGRRAIVTPTLTPPSDQPVLPDSQNATVSAVSDGPTSADKPLDRSSDGVRAARRWRHIGPRSAEGRGMVRGTKLQRMLRWWAARVTTVVPNGAGDKP